MKGLHSNGGNPSNSDQLHRRYLNLLEREKHYQIINDFALNLMYIDSEEDFIWFMVERIISKLNLQDCVVYLLDEEKKMLVQKAAFGDKCTIGRIIENPIMIPLGKGVVGSVAEAGLPEVIPDTSQDTRYIIDDDFRYSEIAIPIIFEDKVIGVIDSEHKEKSFFNDEHLVILSSVASIAAMKIMNLRAFEQLRLQQENLEKQVAEKTKELEWSVEKLRKSNKNLESFAYTVSHDLNQPLRTINSFLHLLHENEPELKKESIEYLNFALNGSKKMSDLLNGLLEYSKIDYTNREFEKLNLSKIINDVVFSLGTIIKENEAVIKITELPYILGNKTQMNQLFQNLISNAIKFRKENVKPRIEINYKPTKDEHVIHVIDNGQGIPSDRISYIFELFYRNQNHEEIKGNGIGLSICRKIMENHGGRIEVVSQEGVGSTFSIAFSK